MFLIGSPEREVNNLLIEAAEAPQRSLKVRPLPSQEVAYHPWPWLAMLFEVVSVQSQYTSGATKNLISQHQIVIRSEILCSLRSLRMTQANMWVITS